MKIDSLTLYLLGMIIIISAVGFIAYFDTKSSIKKSSKK